MICPSCGRDIGDPICDGIELPTTAISICCACGQLLEVNLQRNDARPLSQTEIDEVKKKQPDQYLKMRWAYQLWQLEEQNHAFKVALEEVAKNSRKRNHDQRST